MNERQAQDRRHNHGASPPSDPAAAADQSLMARIARGDQAAFARLYDRYAARMLGLIMKLVHERAAAEDVLQEVFLHVWRKAADYNPALATPLVWLMMISRARAIDALRRSGSEAATRAALGAGGRFVPAIAKRSEDAAGLEHAREQFRQASAALAALPDDQSEAITLAFHGGLTCAQIAESRGVPLGTVKTRIRLGMIKLRDTFARQHEVTA